MSFDDISKEIWDFVAKIFPKWLIQSVIVIGIMIAFFQGIEYVSNKASPIFELSKGKKYASHITFDFVDSTLRPISGIKINSPKNIKKIDEFRFVLDTNLTSTTELLEIINPQQKSVEIYRLNIASDSIQQRSIQIIK